MVAAPVYVAEGMGISAVTRDIHEDVEYKMHVLGGAGRPAGLAGPNAVSSNR